MQQAPLPLSVGTAAHQTAGLLKSGLKLHELPGAEGSEPGSSAWVSFLRTRHGCMHELPQNQTDTGAHVPLSPVS